MKHKLIIALSVVTIISGSLFFGCGTIIECLDNRLNGKARYYNTKYLVHDVSVDAWVDANEKWTFNKSEAKKWLYYEALHWVERTQTTNQMKNIAIEKK